MIAFLLAQDEIIKICRCDTLSAYASIHDNVHSKYDNKLGALIELNINTENPNKNLTNC